MTKQYDSELSLEQLAAMPDEEIDYSDVPPLNERFWQNARLMQPDHTQPVTLRAKRAMSKVADDG